MSTVIEKNTLLKKITENDEIHHPNNVLILKKKKELLGIQFNFVLYGQVAIKTGSKMAWCSRFSSGHSSLKM